MFQIEAEKNQKGQIRIIGGWLLGGSQEGRGQWLLLFLRR